MNETEHRRKTLSPVRAEIMAQLRAWRKRHGTSPTLRELAKMVGKSGPTVLYHVRRLRALDMIEYIDGEARSMLPVEP